MKTTYDKIRWGLLAVIYILFITWGKSNIPIMINIYYYDNTERAKILSKTVAAF